MFRNIWGRTGHGTSFGQRDSGISRRRFTSCGRPLAAGSLRQETVLLLWPGDTVEIAGCALADVQPQEIVLAVRDDRVLHLYAGRKEQAGFFLRGDSMPTPDPAYPSDAFLGKLVQITRMGRSVSLPRRLSRSARAVGLLLCYCETARRLALAVHNWSILKEFLTLWESRRPRHPHPERNQSGVPEDGVDAGVRVECVRFAHTVEFSG